jgi:hypothetical protein
LRSRLAIAALLIAAAPLPAGDEHLLAGARAFREGRFDLAYVEFSVAEKLGAGGEAAWYAAAALVKLQRPEEALEAFSRAQAAAPQASDALLDYYRALACYGARLYACADALLARVRAQAGPKVAAEAEAMRKDIRALFAQAPDTRSIDWYHRRGADAAAQGRTALAAAYYDEAAALGGLRADRYRSAEARKRASVARGQGRR